VALGGRLRSVKESWLDIAVATDLKGLGYDA
jgi:hypothetical protein